MARGTAAGAAISLGRDCCHLRNIAEIPQLMPCLQVPQQRGSRIQAGDRRAVEIRPFEHAEESNTNGPEVKGDPKVWAAPQVAGECVGELAELEVPTHGGRHERLEATH